MLPVWVLTVAIVLAIALTLWSYLSYQSVSVGSKIALIGLRISAFVLLFVLLLNPRFDQISTIERLPVISILVDDTQSVRVEKPDWQGADSMLSLLNQLKSQFQPEEAKLEWYSFYRSLERIESVSDLLYDKSGTDLYQVLTEYDQHSTSDGTILISDGISTSGRDPAFAGRMMSRPVFVVAVGDTSVQRDLVLQGVDYPRNAFINSEVVISTTIRNDGFANQEITVLLRSGAEIVDRKRIRTSGNRSTHQVDFVYETTQVGLETFSIEIVPVEGEWSTRNNARTISIDFQDDQTRILYLSFEIHPDVGALRNVLETNPSIIVTPRTWISEERFAEGILPTATDTFDLVIVHGLPESVAMQARLSELVSQQSSLILLTPMVSSVKWNRVTQNLAGRPSIRFDRGVQAIQLRPASDETGHPVLSLPPVELNRMPVLQSPVAGITASEIGTNILFASFRGELTTTPVLTLSQIGNNRNAYILVYGLHQLFLQGDDDHRRWIDALLTNIVIWSAAEVQDNQFEISPILSEFDSGESVQFTAEVRDDTGNPEASAQVNLRIALDDTNEFRNFTLQSNGRGRYSLNMGSVPEGRYMYEAEARVGTQLLGTKNGVFQVGNSLVEFIVTQRNDEALQQIASGSGGVFLTHQDIQALKASIAEIISNRSKEVYITPIHVNRSRSWFLMLLLILMTEWLFRKKLALP
jgi:hypothetical protein